jgi:hypothetical protein
MEDTTTNELEELEYPEDERLFKIAYWSKAVSWVILVIGVLKAFFDIGKFYFSPVFGGAIPSEDLVWVSNMFLSGFSSLFSVAFYFFVLQAVAEILYLVIDIKEQLYIKEA